jgi:pimeloyl-ACP methyl ester carboxylesterase
MQTHAMKFLKGFAILLLLLIIVYFLGPKPSIPRYATDLPAVPADAVSLERYIAKHEGLHKLKPDNQARIIWLNDSAKQKTTYSVVYIHGFSASQEEGDPVHYEFAKKFGCNLFLHRLEDHGVDTTEPLLTLTADRMWESAKEAYMVGRQLGEKVILMATSTGASLALKLAGEYPNIAALILLSPNIAINDSKAWLLNNHWGLQIARMVKGKYNRSDDTTALHGQYWNNKYRMEAAVQLQEFLETSMKESTFQKVKQPTLVLYYYKDEEHQDDVVKVSAIKRMYMQLGTPGDQKRAVAIPGAGDHVLGSYITSKDIAGVQKECEKFAIEVLRFSVQ